MMRNDLFYIKESIWTLKMLGHSYQKYASENNNIEIRIGHINNQQFNENLFSVREYKRALNFIRLDEDCSENDYQVRYWKEDDIINYGEKWINKKILYSTLNSDYAFKLVVYKKKDVNPLLNKPVSFSRLIHRESSEYTFGSVTVLFEVSKVENIEQDGHNKTTYEFEIKLVNLFIDNEETEKDLDRAIEVALKVIYDTNLLYTRAEVANFRKKINERLGISHLIQPSYFPIRRPLTYDDFPNGLIDGDVEYYVSETPKGQRKIVAFDETGIWAWYPPNDYSLIERNPILQTFDHYIFETIEILPENRKKKSKDHYKNKYHHKRSVFYIIDCLSNQYYGTKIQEYGYKQRLKIARKFTEVFDDINVYLDIVSYHKIDRNNIFSICSNLLDFLNEAPYVHDGLTFTPDTRYNPTSGVFIYGNERKLKNYPDTCRWYPKYNIDAYVKIDQDGNIGLWGDGYIRFPGNLNPEDPILKQKNNKFISDDVVVEFEYNENEDEFLQLKGVKLRKKYKPNNINQINEIWKLMKDPITADVITGVSNFSLMSHYHERIIKLLGGIPFNLANQELDNSLDSIFVDIFNSTSDVIDITKKLVPGGKITFLTFDREAIKELINPSFGGYSQSKFEGPNFSLELDDDVVILRNTEGEEIIYKSLNLEILGELGEIEKYRADTEINSNQPPLMNNREYLLSRIHAYGEITLSSKKEMSSKLLKSKCGNEVLNESNNKFGPYLSMIPTKSNKQIRHIQNNWDPSFNDDSSQGYVRIGSIGDGSCFFHSVLQAVYPPYNEMTFNEKLNLVIHLRFDISSILQDEISIDDEYPLSKWALHSDGALALQFLFQIIRYQEACYYRHILKKKPYHKNKKDPRDPINPDDMEFEKEDQSELGLVLRIANSKVYTGEIEGDLLGDALGIDFLIFELRENGLPEVRSTRNKNSKRPCVMIGYTGGHYETIGKIETNKKGEKYIKLLWESNSLPVTIFKNEVSKTKNTFKSTMDNFIKQGNEALNELFINASNEDDRLVIFRYFRSKGSFSSSFEYMLTQLFRNYKINKNKDPPYPKGSSKITTNEWPDEPDEEESNITEPCLLNQVDFLEVVDSNSDLLEKIKEVINKKKPTKKTIKNQSPKKNKNSEKRSKNSPAS